MVSAEADRAGELLVEEGVVTLEDVARAISEGGLKGTVLAAALEASGHVRRADLAAFLGRDFRIPTIEDLREVPLARELAQLVPEEVARRHEFVPLARLGHLLCVAKANYYNRMAIQEVRALTHLKVKVVQADGDQVRAALDWLYKGREAVLPAPRGARPGVAREEAGVGGIPLISMPQESSPGDLVEILRAVRVSAGEFAAVAGDPRVRLIGNFAELFQGVNPIPACRMV